MEGLPDRTGKAPATWTEPAIIELALRVAAINGGDAAKTAKMMREQSGIEVRAANVSRWIKQFPDRYGEFFDAETDAIQRQAAIEATRIAGKAAEGTELLVQDTIRRRKELEPRDVAPSARALAQVHASMSEKAALNMGQPTARVGHTIDGYVDQLRDLGLIKGEEPKQIADAEVVPEEESVGA